MNEFYMFLVDSAYVQQLLEIVGMREVDQFFERLVRRVHFLNSKEVPDPETEQGS
jgi:hypothetical protein